jgi:hypothetical protein
MKVYSALAQAHISLPILGEEKINGMTTVEDMEVQKMQEELTGGLPETIINQLIELNQR